VLRGDGKMGRELKQSYFKKIMSIRGMGQVLTVTVGLAVLFIVFGFLNPTFASSKNIGN
jgi:ribose transport system permease protein